VHLLGAAGLSVLAKLLVIPLFSNNVMIILSQDYIGIFLRVNDILWVLLIFYYLLCWEILSQ
jgi:hypothetical protein